MSNCAMKIDKICRPIQECVVIPVMWESQSHCTMKVSEAMVVSVDEVKSQGPLDWATSLAWRSTYHTGSIKTNTLPNLTIT